MWSVALGNDRGLSSKQQKPRRRNDTINKWELRFYCSFVATTGFVFRPSQQINCCDFSASVSHDRPSPHQQHLSSNINNSSNNCCCCHRPGCAGFLHADDCIHFLLHMAPFHLCDLTDVPTDWRLKNPNQWPSHLPTQLVI